MTDIAPHVWVVLLIPLLVAGWASLPSRGLYYQLRFWMCAPGAMIIMLCAPIFVYQGYHQFNASARLSEVGLPRPPDALHAMGAQGGRAPRYIWRYAIKNVTDNTVSEYALEARRAGWVATREKGKPLQLQRSNSRYSVFLDDFGNETHLIIQKEK